MSVLSPLFARFVTVAHGYVSSEEREDTKHYNLKRNDYENFHIENRFTVDLDTNCK